MTTKDEALQMALEWIEAQPEPRMISAAKVVQSLRAALALTDEQEPVAYLYTLEYGQSTYDKKVSIHQLNYPFGVCGADYLAKNDEGVSYVRQTKLYTAPPKRKPLTDEKLRAMWVNYAPIVGGVLEFARAIEKAHGIGVDHDA